MSAETDHGLRTVPMPMNRKRTARLDGIAFSIRWEPSATEFLRS
jgi:hypothetical protein